MQRSVADASSLDLKLRSRLLTCSPNPSREPHQSLRGILSRGGAPPVVKSVLVFRRGKFVNRDRLINCDKSQPQKVCAHRGFRIVELERLPRSEIARRVGEGHAGLLNQCANCGVIAAVAVLSQVGIQAIDSILKCKKRFEADIAILEDQLHSEAE